MKSDVFGVHFVSSNYPNRDMDGMSISCSRPEKCRKITNFRCFMKNLAKFFMLRESNIQHP